MIFGSSNLAGIRDFLSRESGARFLKEHPQITSIFIVLCGNVFNNAVTFVINILLAKKFGPEGFGIFSLAVSVMILVNIISDIGLSLTLVRFFNLYDKDTERQNLLLLSLFLFRLIIITLLVILAFPLGAAIARLMGVGGYHRALFSLAIITGGIFTLWAYFQNFQQAHRRFRRLTAFILGYGLLRILIFSLFMAYTHTLENAYAYISLYTIPVFIITFIGISSIFSRIIYVKSFNVPRLYEVLKKALNYSKWVAISSVFYNSILRVVQFVLAARSSKYELGVLSAGFVFTVAFLTLNMALRTVFFPHVTAFEETKDMKEHLSRVKKFSPVYALLGFLFIFALAVIQRSFLGIEYQHALPVFIISSIALAATIFMGLISMLVHTLMHPEVDAVVNIVRLIAAALLVYVLAPRFGAIGGAVSYAVAIVFGELYLILFVSRKVHESS